MTALLDPPRPVDAAPASWRPLLVVLVGTFMTFLDFFIVNVALPSIGGDLHATGSSVSLVVAGYGVAFAAGMITGGRLGDLYGRRRMFLLGLALFTLTSLACGLAPSIGALIAARVLQGAAGALLTPQVLAIVGTTYEGPRLQRAFAAYGIAMGVAGVLGQLLGGALISSGLGWRAIFLVNVPVGLLVLVLAQQALPESHGARTRLDLPGVALVSLALVALVVPLAEGHQHGWPAWAWVSLALSVGLAAAFWASQRSAAAPLVPPALLRVRSFRCGTLAASTFALVPSSFFFILALHLQDDRGYSPLFSGVVFTAVGVGYFTAIVLAGPLAARLGRQVLALGAGAAALGCVALVDASGSAWALVPGLALVGLGIGLVLVPVSSLVLADVDPLHAGAAAGVLATGQQIGGAVGVAVMSTVFFTGGFATALWTVVGLAAATVAAAQTLD